MHLMDHTPARPQTEATTITERTRPPSPRKNARRNPQEDWPVTFAENARSVATAGTRNVAVARGLATTAATRDGSDIVQLKRICHANYVNYRPD